MRRGVHHGGDRVRLHLISIEGHKECLESSRSVVGSNHWSLAGTGKMTGMRLWMGSINLFGTHVRIAQVATCPTN